MARPPKLSRLALAALCALLCEASSATAQNTPLISGGIAFLSSTNGGNTSYLPIYEPVLSAPVGKHFLLEGRATLADSFFPKGGGQPGYDRSGFYALTYLQGDIIASRHMTIVAGSFLTPFNTFNERLSPVWINNLQDTPLVANLGQMGTGTGLGGELRGSAISRAKYSIDYVGYFSARSANMQFNSERSTGGRGSLYLPEKGLEVGLSYARLLQGKRENFYGAHVWWEPPNTNLKLRSEFARTHHVQGYWVEANYRTDAFGGLDSWVGRFEPVVRVQQTFRRDTIVSDGLPLVNTQRVDFGMDYNVTHSTRILTSYARQFSSTSNVNIWETGIVYRFLFPAWKGKQP